MNAELEIVVVSRHPAAIEFCCWELRFGLPRQRAVAYRDHLVIFSRYDGEESLPCFEDCPDVAMPDDLTHPRSVFPLRRGNATPEDVRGKRLAGNVPLHLAACAHVVEVIEFDGAPPRGVDYDIDAMRDAGARLVSYCVRSTTEIGDVGPEEAIYRNRPPVVSGIAGIHGLHGENADN